MSGKLRLTGATSGYIELQAEAAANNATLTIPNAGFGGGKILQVLSVHKSDFISYASSTEADISGLSQNITMTASSNKVLVIIDLALSGNTYPQAFLKRGTTYLHRGDAASGRIQVLGGGYTGGTYAPFYYGAWSLHKHYLDTPGAGTHTYKMAWAARSGTCWLNGTGYNDATHHPERTASSLTLMEVSA